MIIPLGRRSLAGSSGLPVGPNGLGQPSPPIWPCTARGLPLHPDVATGAVGFLTPPFHPYQAPRPLKTCLRFRLRPITEAAAPAVSFLWHCPWLNRHRLSPLALPGAPPPAESGLSSRDLPFGASLAITPARSPALIVSHGPGKAWQELRPPHALFCKRVRKLLKCKRVSVRIAQDRCKRVCNLFKNGRKGFVDRHADKVN